MSNINNGSNLVNDRSYDVFYLGDLISGDDFKISTNEFQKFKAILNLYKVGDLNNDGNINNYETKIASAAYNSNIFQDPDGKNKISQREMDNFKQHLREFLLQPVRDQKINELARIVNNTAAKDRSEKNYYYAPLTNVESQ